MMAVVACFFAVGAGSVGQVEAAALYTPATYWNGNANYPVAFTQAGVNRYLILSEKNRHQFYLLLGILNNFNNDSN